VDFPDLAPDEPLSPELVLVLPPELRARVIAALGDPVWPTPRPPEPAATSARPLIPLAPARVRRPAFAEPPAHSREPFLRSLAMLVGARVAQLGLIFVAVTILTLVLTLVAQAVR
jgi:hypothetical protein